MSKKPQMASIGACVPKALLDEFGTAADVLGHKAKAMAAALHGFAKLSENQRWKLYQEVHAQYYADPHDDA